MTAKSDSGFERYTVYEVATILGMTEQHCRDLLASLPRKAGVRPRKEPRGWTYDAVAIERILRAKGIPTTGRPGSPDWLTKYQERKNS